MEVYNGWKFKGGMKGEVMMKDDWKVGWTGDGR